MATVDFSVPDEVRDAFNATFRDRNKSAIVAELMRRIGETNGRSALPAEHQPVNWPPEEHAQVGATMMFEILCVVAEARTARL